MSDTTPYQVPKEPGRWRALTLAVVVHAALLAFLYVGIRWHNETPVAVEAEVWSATAKEAAPKPQPEPEAKPEPKPEVKEPPKPVERKPDIALEQEKKKLAEQKERDRERERLEKVSADLKARELAKSEAARKAQAEKWKSAAEAKAAEQRREQELKRMMAGTGGSGDAPKAQGPGRADPGYAQRVGAKIKSNTVFNPPEGLAGNPPVEYALDLLPDGSLRGLRKVKSSGVPGFDEAVARAIERSQPYPPDKSGTVPGNFIVSHKPKDQ
jgi:colicin import membrane protein